MPLERSPNVALHLAADHSGFRPLKSLCIRTQHSALTMPAGELGCSPAVFRAIRRVLHK